MDSKSKRPYYYATRSSTTRSSAVTSNATATTATQPQPPPLQNPVPKEQKKEKEQECLSKISTIMSSGEGLKTGDGVATTMAKLPTATLSKLPDYDEHKVQNDWVLLTDHSEAWRYAYSIGFTNVSNAYFLDVGGCGCCLPKCVAAGLNAYLAQQAKRNPQMKTKKFTHIDVRAMWAERITPNTVDSFLNHEQLSGRARYPNNTYFPVQELLKITDVHRRVAETQRLIRLSSDTPNTPHVYWPTSASLTELLLDHPVMVALQIGVMVVSEYKFDIRPTTDGDFVLPAREVYVNPRDMSKGTKWVQDVIHVDPFRRPNTKHLIYLHAVSDHHYRILGVYVPTVNERHCVFPIDKIPPCIAQFDSNIIKSSSSEQATTTKK